MSAWQCKPAVEGQWSSHTNCYPIRNQEVSAIASSFIINDLAWQTHTNTLMSVFPINVMHYKWGKARNIIL